MRVLLLNQFVPPAQPPTAKLMGDLARAVQSAGHEARCIGVGGNYQPARGAQRILRDLTAHVRMAAAVLRAGPCDWLIAFSDPMGLPVTARILAWVKGASLAHWAMDVYPQTAIALGAAREGWLTKLVSAAMRFGYRGCRLLVALDRDMQTELARVSRQSVEVLSPWPPEIVEKPQLCKQRSNSRRWLYSGNLGRAHDYETLLEAQKILEERGSAWELHFQGGGPARAEAETLARQLNIKHCHWEPYVPEDDLLPALLSADVLIATQRPATRGLLWPSKLALMKHLGLPIVWVGPTEGAVAEELRNGDSHAGIFAPREAAALADWLEHLEVPAPTTPLDVIRQRVQIEREAGGQWWLQRLGSSPS